MENKRNNVFTEIEINATPEQVWDVLTDWDKLKEWSSSFIGISKDQMILGEEFVSFFKNPLGGRPFELKHICTDYEEGRKFGWSGTIVGKVHDHHIYSIAPLKNGRTIFRQEDGLHGKHSKFLNWLAEHKMIPKYKKFNQELKERVETLFPKD